MLFYMLLAYGICFGLQNKLPFLYSRKYRETGEPSGGPLDKLLHCTYCTGFHCGWMVWLAAWGVTGDPVVKNDWRAAVSVLTWAFASAAFCYTADAVVKWLEANTEA